MQYEFRGKTIREAVGRATSANKGQSLDTKGGNSTRVWAPPLVWGPWQEVFSQFGVVGPNSNNHVTRVTVSFATQSNVLSTFDVEIRGGDQDIRSIGPGSETITITGNVATSISVRCKSHVAGQNVVITARW